MDSLLRALTRAAFRRGMSGQHWTWFVLAGAAFVLRRARRPDDLATTIDLAPGDRYLLSLHDPAERGADRDTR